MAAEVAPKVISGIKIDAGDVLLLQNALNKIDALNTLISSTYQEYLRQQGFVDQYRNEYYNCDNCCKGVGKDKRIRECKDAVTKNWNEAETRRDTSLRNYNSLKDTDLVAAKDEYNTLLLAVENKIKLQIQGQTTTTNSQIALIQANQSGTIATTKLEQSGQTKKYVIFGVVIIVIILAGIYIYKKFA